ncbi:MAG: histidinol-phosphate transaminase [Deltaproteobacteria bacterium]|nr:histidinol-phosphate transaminase [Deltaproteobacteria bacterium]
MSNSTDLMHNPLQLCLRPELSELDAYVPFAAPEGTLRLDANESPPLPKSISDAIHRAAHTVALERYPDARATALRHAIAQWTQSDPGQLLIGTGSDEVIGLILSGLSRPREGRTRAVCLYPTPTFVMYRVSALACGVEPVGVALDAQWDLDVAALCAAMDEHDPSVIFLATPNNPTGNRFSRDRIEALIAHSKGRALIVLDEAYGPFADSDDADLMGAHGNVARLGTLSKIGLAAVRVGWAALPEWLAFELDKSRQPFNVDAIAQAMATVALNAHSESLRAHARGIADARRALSQALAQRVGVTVYPSEANFVWVDVGGDAAHVFEALLAEGVLVRSFHRQGGRLRGCLRITVSTEAHHERLLQSLDRVLSRS